MELLTIIVISAFTSLIVSALFHLFTMKQAVNWIDDFFAKQEIEMGRFFADLKDKLKA